MKFSPVLPHPGRALVSTCVAALLAAFSSPSHAALSAGALAIVGYNDNASDSSGTDSFALVATETIYAGEVIYVTNNGWNNSASDRKFDGAHMAGEVGSGFENLVKLTITSDVTAGTVINSSVNNSSWGWDTSSSIPMPMGATGTFSALDLKHSPTSGFASYGDQIYVFQGDETNPLLNVTSFVYALSMGDRLAGEVNWYAPDSQRGGEIPDGLVAQNPYDTSIYNTIDPLSDVENGDPWDNTALGLDPTSEFYNGTFGLDLSNMSVLALQTSGGTKEEWLRMINDSSHWTSTPVVFDTPLNFGIVPEPSRLFLLGLGMGAGILRRRRNVCE